MKNQIFKLKKYNNYQEIPNQYKWDLDDILNGKTIDQLINEYFSLFDELILIKDSKYETIENYISYLNINKSFLILKNKIINYFSNLININIVDSKVLKQNDDFELKEQEYQIKLGSEINKIYKNKDIIKKWLNDPRLKDVKKDLEFIIQNFDHKLDDNVEKYLNETYIGDPSLEDIFSTLTNSEIDFGYAISKNNKKYKITESSRVLLLKNKDEKIRKTTYYGYLNGFYNLRETLTKLLYQHLKRISIESSIRKYESSIKSLISIDKIEIAFLTNLFSSVTNKTNKIFKNFLKYKSIFFKKKFNKKMELWDSYLELVNVKNNYKIEEIQKIVIDATSIMPYEYNDKIIEAINNRWIDYVECPNKMSGAYSIGSSYGINKKYILMNYDGSINSIKTLIHELGHSLHSYYSSKNQSIFRSEYTLFLAEIASIFNELLLTDYLFLHAKNDEEKFYILSESINDFIGTVIKQCEWANFEFDLYNLIDSNNTFNSYFEIEKVYVNNSNKYLLSNKINKIGNKANIYSVSVPHFYYDFYVYKYAIGYIIANVFYNRYLQNGKYELENYVNNFLSAGDKDYPANILKSCGIDIYDQKIFDEAFNVIENKINEYIKLGKRIFKIK